VSVIYTYREEGPNTVTVAAKRRHVRLYGRARREPGTDAGILHVQPLVVHAAGEGSEGVHQRAGPEGLAAPPQHTV